MRQCRLHCSLPLPAGGEAVPDRNGGWERPGNGRPKPGNHSGRTHAASPVTVILALRPLRPANDFVIRSRPRRGGCACPNPTGSRHLDLVYHAFLRFAIILTCQRVPAHPEGFHSHVQAILEVADLAAVVVRPFHGNLAHRESELAGQEQQFGIESPALDFLPGKQSLCRPRGECLKAALRVLEAQPQQQPQMQIEYSSEKLAVEGLAFGLQFAAQPARTDSHLGAIREGGEKLVGFLNGRGQVGVAEQQQVATGVQHAVADTIAFASISRVLEQANRAVPLRVTAYDGGCVVARAIIYNDHFRVPALLPDVVQHFIQRGGDALALIVGGNDDAVLRLVAQRGRHAGRQNSSHPDFDGTAPVAIAKARLRHACIDVGKAGSAAGIYATCACAVSMARNSSTRSPSHSPAFASSRMVLAASSWLRAGL